MLFIDDEGNYPKHIGDVQLVNKNYVYGDDLPAGWHEVQPSTPPQTTENQKIIATMPEEIDGVYYQRFEVIDLTDEEIEFQTLSLEELRKRFI